MKTIQPIGDKILVEPIKNSAKTFSGIYLPENASDKLTINNIVVITSYAGNEIDMDGAKYLLVSLSDILGKLKEYQPLKKMKQIYLIKIFRSDYCRIVFAVALIVSYFLVPPRLFEDLYIFLAAAFMVSFALTITCMIWTMKERALLAKKKGASVLAIIVTAVGVSSLQLCGIGTPICYISLGMNFFAALIPSSLFFPLMNYSIYLVIFSIAFQMFSLYKMGFFKQVHS